ncbi:MAG: hypothetical protein HZA51_14390 [Planctomycetes bacterium]|nr:hypothetical protein [Planctomycetota bacterium]
MSTPKLRMIAGPNGAGKSTLFSYLGLNFSFPLGYCLNPDAIEREIREHQRLYVGGWGTRLNEPQLVASLKRHPLLRLNRGPWPSLQNDIITFSKPAISNYTTTAICDCLRDTWLKSGESFTFETVMSHAGKIALLQKARKRGYRVYLYYVCTDSVLINRERIKIRQQQGGHGVPADRISARYDRSLRLLGRAIAHCDRAYLFDNSGRSHELVGEFDSGQLVWVQPSTPSWFSNHAIQKK